MNALDLAVHNNVIGYRTDLLTAFFVPLTKTTGPTAMAIVAVMCSFALLWKHNNYAVALYIPTAVLLANLSSHILKAMINRPRPPLEDQLLYQFNPAMPSGHAVGVCALAMAISLMRRKVWASLLWILAILVSFSRLYVGVHWFSDVLVGSLVGIVIAVIVWSIFRRLGSLRPVT